MSGSTLDLVEGNCSEKEWLMRTRARQEAVTRDLRAGDCSQWVEEESTPGGLNRR
jgi:hypothetical protein